MCRVGKELRIHQDNILSKGENGEKERIKKSGFLSDFILSPSVMLL